MRRIELAYLQAAIRRAGSKRGAASVLGVPIEKVKYLCASMAFEGSPELPLRGLNFNPRRGLVFKP